jgi:hypothetical protein
MNVPFLILKVYERRVVSRSGYYVTGSHPFAASSRHLCLA